MKKVLSLLLAMAMVISLVPSVFAAEDVGGTPDVGLWNAEVITDLETTKETVLAEGDSDGYYYIWTADADGNVSFTGECEDGEFDIIVTCGDVVAYLSESEDNTVAVDVSTGDKVYAQVVALPDAENNYPAMTVSVWGTFTYPAGTEQNPIPVEYVWNETYTEATATVVAPVGTTYYCAYGSGMLLSIDGGEPIVLQSMNPRDPAVFTITNDGEAEAEYSLVFAVPVGTWDNPAELVIGGNDVSLPEGSDGYYYSWIAEGTGTLTAYIGSITEGVEADIVINNNTTGINKTLLADGVDNNGMEVSIDVNEGDEISIQVVVQPDANWATPAADIYWVSRLDYPAGSEQNPIPVEYVWNETYTEATATVVAPVGTTYYSAYANGLLLSIDGSEPIALQSMNPRDPAVFTITNDGEAEAEYSLVFAVPVGTWDNPAELVIGGNDVSLPESSDGYYYSWIAEGTGTLVAYIGTITEGVEADIIINNNTTGINKTLLADGVDNNGMEVSIDVNEGDEISIQIVVQPDANWATPAADIYWVSRLDYPAGSEQNPISPEFVWNDAQTEATATVIVPAGTTTYYAIGNGGMMLSVDGGEAFVVQASMWAGPHIISLTNDGEEDAEHTFALWYPAGNMSNPAALAMGANTAEIAAGTEGYFYTWTAEVDGTLSITMPEGNWFYVINNITTGAYGDSQWSDSDPVVNPAVIEVTAGDVIQVIVNTYDPEALWSAPAGTLVFNASFAEPEPEQPEFEITGQPTDTNSGINESGVFTVEVNLEGATYQWYVDKQDGNGFVPATYTGNKTNTLSITYYDNRVGWQVYCKVTAPDGTVIDTEIATWTIREANLTITGGSSGNRAVVLNTTATFVINVEGDDVIYQWQVDVNDGKGFVNVTPTSYKGYNEKRLYITAYPKTEGYKVRCVVMDSTGGRTYGPVATLTIKDNPLVVTEHPASQEVVLDSTVTFKAACSGNVGDVSYIWMISGDGGATWSKTGLKGFNTDTLTVSAYNSRNGKMFKCVMQDSEKNKIETEPALLSLKANPLKITTNATSKTAAVNTDVEFTFVVGGEPVGDVSYQWYYRRSADGQWGATSMTGAKSSTLIVGVTAARNGYQYYCKAVDGAGNVMKSRVVTLTVG